MKVEEYIKTKVTTIDGRHHCRLIDKRDGKVISEVACRLKEDIAFCFHYLLRWHNKLGGDSPMADAARHRLKHTNMEPKGKIWYPSQIPVVKR